jgi:hypothetical protein
VQVKLVDQTDFEGFRSASNEELVLAFEQEPMRVPLQALRVTVV